MIEVLICCRGTYLLDYYALWFNPIKISTKYLSPHRPFSHSELNSGSLTLKYISRAHCGVCCKRISRVIKYIYSA
jgi:hypothetical protein